MFITPQSWTNASGHLLNMAKSACFANLPKVLIFDLLGRRVTINDFSVEELGTTLPLDTLTCLKPMTI